MDIELIVNITSKAWALPILAQLHAGIAARQAPLLAATGAGRTALRQSMDHLIALRLLERNPGYGHPLRPEFRMTPMGQTVAEVASDILDALDKEERRLLRRSWTLPVLITLRKPQQFVGIKRNLVIISDRALSQSLQQMEEREWIDRRVDETARPPRPIYTAINRGAVICEIATPVTLAG